MRHRVLELGLEQISEPGVGQLPLGLGGPRLEHPDPALPGRLDRAPPQRRLADPGLTLEQHRSRTRPEVLQLCNAAANSPSRPTRLSSMAHDRPYRDGAVPGKSVPE